MTYITGYGSNTEVASMTGVAAGGTALYSLLEDGTKIILDHVGVDGATDSTIGFVELRDADGTKIHRWNWLSGGLARLHQKGFNCGPYGMKLSNGATFFFTNDAGASGTDLVLIPKWRRVGEQPGDILLNDSNSARLYDSNNVRLAASASS